MKPVTISFAIVVCIQLYHHIKADGVTRCYNCLDDCSQRTIQEQTCSDEGVYSCLSITGEGAGTDVHIKRCVADDETQIIDDCALLNELEGFECYICQEDLCNFNTVNGTQPDTTAVYEISTQTPATQCYNCFEDCSDTGIHVEECAQDAHSCVSVIGERAGTQINFKKCLADGDIAMRDSCTLINAVEGFTCYTCAGDLCNLNFVQDIDSDSTTDDETPTPTPNNNTDNNGAVDLYLTPAVLIASIYFVTIL